MPVERSLIRSEKLTDDKFVEVGLLGKQQTNFANDFESRIETLERMIEDLTDCDGCCFYANADNLSFTGGDIGYGVYSNPLFFQNILTHGANITTDATGTVYIAPKSGWYQVNLILEIDVTWATPPTPLWVKMMSTLFRAGTKYKNLGFDESYAEKNGSGTLTNQYQYNLGGSSGVYLTAGDSLDVRIISNTTTPSSPPTTIVYGGFDITYQCDKQAEEAAITNTYAI